MASAFRARGVRAVAVHSGINSAPRHSSIDQLARGELDMLFSVDMFNEGLDVPTIDTVLLLRPTSSPVVFLQQLGRGLRLSEGKTHSRQSTSLVTTRASYRPLAYARARVQQANVGPATRMPCPSR
jgi:superfamily II DNA or RNA helicase